MGVVCSLGGAMRPAHDEGERCRAADELRNRHGMHLRVATVKSVIQAYGYPSGEIVRV